MHVKMHVHDSLSRRHDNVSGAGFAPAGGNGTAPPAD
jgi:hypothetical protein